MGSESKYIRYRESGERANDYNIEEYGSPVRSLFTSTKILTLHHHIDITDEMGNVVYEVDTQFPSIHDKTDITTADGRHVAHIERKLLTIHNRHYVFMADGTSFQISTELLHSIKDVINIEELGWQMRGNVLALNFQLYVERGQLIAIISQKLFSIHDKYCVDLYMPEHEEVVVAILVTLQHIICDRESASSAGGGSSSSGE